MPLFNIKNLTHFFGGLRAVYDFNLTLEGGELMGLIGPNGAGKTTVFNLVCGVYRPTRGEITFNGTSLVGLMPHQIAAKGIARTFQNIRLWNALNVLDNIKMACSYQLGYGLIDSFLRTKRFWEREKELNKKALELLEILNLRQVAYEFPLNLPYGLQRRVEIARALAAGPKLLLLDEPTAGMNPAEVGEMMEFIQWVRKEFDLTVWIIEHQMRVIMGICEWIKVIDFGETIAEGTPEEIQRNQRVIEAYLGEEE